MSKISIDLALAIGFMGVIVLIGIIMQHAGAQGFR